MEIKSLAPTIDLSNFEQMSPDDLKTKIQDQVSTAGSKYGFAGESKDLYGIMEKFAQKNPGANVQDFKNWFTPDGANSQGEAASWDKDIGEMILSMAPGKEFNNGSSISDVIDEAKPLGLKKDVAASTTQLAGLFENVLDLPAEKAAAEHLAELHNGSEKDSES